LPYQPFVEAFDQFLSEQGRPSSENPITHFSSSSGDMERDQRTLFNAAATFLTDIAVESPVLLLVDDLHAADEVSLHLFHYLARQTRSAPVVLFVTYRTDLASSAATPFASLLNVLYRERLTETLNLSPLSKDAAALIVNHRLSGKAASPLVEAIQDIAEGNPFFIQEITRSLLKSDRLEERDGHWNLKIEAELRAPANLEGLLRERVTRLGVLVESTLISAAVLGQEFDFESLRAMTALPDFVKEAPKIHLAKRQVLSQSPHWKESGLVFTTDIGTPRIRIICSSTSKQRQPKQVCQGSNSTA
jgi:predicted ATPase